MAGASCPLCGERVEDADGYRRHLGQVHKLFDDPGTKTELPPEVARPAHEPFTVPTTRVPAPPPGGPAQPVTEARARREPRRSGGAGTKSSAGGKKAGARKTAVVGKKASAKKPAAKKAAGKKAAGKKAAGKKAAGKKAAGKTAANETAAKKAAGNKAAGKKAAARRARR